MNYNHVENLPAKRFETSSQVHGPQPDMTTILASSGSLTCFSKHKTYVFVHDCFSKNRNTLTSLWKLFMKWDLWHSQDQLWNHQLIHKWRCLFYFVLVKPFQNHHFWELVEVGCIHWTPRWEALEFRALWEAVVAEGRVSWVDPWKMPRFYPVLRGTLDLQILLQIRFTIKIELLCNMPSILVWL